MKLVPKVQKKINPKEVLKQKRSYVDKVHEELEEKGVDFFKPSEQGGSLHIDTDYLSLPKNITDIPAKELGEYLNAFTQQKLYIRTLLGWAECLCEEAQREYMSVSQDLYRSLPAKMSEKAKEREVTTDEEIIPYYETYVELRRKCSLLEMNIANIEDIIFMISREVSRRTGDFNNETRNFNVLNH